MSSGQDNRIELTEDALDSILERIGIKMEKVFEQLPTIMTTGIANGIQDAFNDQIQTNQDLREDSRRAGGASRPLSSKIELTGLQKQRAGQYLNSKKWRPYPGFRAVSSNT